MRTARASGATCVGVFLVSLLSTPAWADCGAVLATLSGVASVRHESECGDGAGALFDGDRLSLRPGQGLRYLASAMGRDFDVVCSSEVAEGLKLSVSALEPIVALVPDGARCAWSDLGVLRCAVDGAAVWSCDAFEAASGDSNPGAALGAIAAASIRGSDDGAYPDLFASAEVAAWRGRADDRPALARLLREELLETQPHRFAAWAWVSTTPPTEVPPAGAGVAREVQRALEEGRRAELLDLFPAKRVATVEDPWVLLVVAQLAVDAGSDQLALGAIARLDWQVAPDLFMSAVVLRRLFDRRPGLEEAWSAQVQAEPRLARGLVPAWLAAADRRGELAATETWLAARPDDPMALAWRGRLLIDAGETAAGRAELSASAVAWPFSSPLGAWASGAP